MTIVVNSKPQELPEAATVADLIEQMKLGEKRVAVEVNTELVTKTEWKSHRLKDGDKVEVVTFVGGG
ncbi:MAG TPA: sulfur carrier protein ThiS [Planctomycetota bacterium]|nr:sulfur carrier protein ThiS [Planctomycetota bacterium]